MKTLIEVEKLDKKIKPIVYVLREHGFETFESCQGGEGHALPDPTVRFFGNEFDLIRAYEVCKLYGFDVFEVKRVYRKAPIYDSDLNEKGLSWDKPFNEITFKRV